VPLRPSKGILSCVLAFFRPAPFSGPFSRLQRPRRRSRSISISRRRPCMFPRAAEAIAGRFRPPVGATGPRAGFSIPKGSSLCTIRKNTTCRPCPIPFFSRAATRFMELMRQGRLAARLRMAAFVCRLPMRRFFTEWSRQRARRLPSRVRLRMAMRGSTARLPMRRDGGRRARLHPGREILLPQGGNKPLSLPLAQRKTGY
jgi:hypothetical protein